MGCLVPAAPVGLISSRPLVPEATMFFLLPLPSPLSLYVAMCSIVFFVYLHPLHVRFLHLGASYRSQSFSPEIRCSLVRSRDRCLGHTVSKSTCPPHPICCFLLSLRARPVVRHGRPAVTAHVTEVLARRRSIVTYGRLLLGRRQGPIGRRLGR